MICMTDAQRRLLKSEEHSRLVLIREEVSIEIAGELAHRERGKDILLRDIATVYLNSTSDSFRWRLIEVFFEGKKHCTEQYIQRFLSWIHGFTTERVVLFKAVHKNVDTEIFMRMFKLNLC
jgi:hypothetical protein